MNVWTHDRWHFPLPEAHKFPISKYALLRERVTELGLCAPDEVHESEPVAWEALGRPYQAAIARWRQAEAFVAIGDRDGAVVPAREAIAADLGRAFGLPAGAFRPIVRAAALASRRTPALAAALAARRHRTLGWGDRANEGPDPG